MKVVVGTLHTGEHFIRELADAFPDVEFVPAYADSEQPDAIVDADVFMGWPTREAFLAARQLKWIHCPGAGIDKLIAIPEIVASDLPITNAPGPHVNPMADHVIGMMVALTHKFREMARDQDKRFWAGADKYDHTFTEISDSTMGIYGLGAIGRAVARRAAGFDMRIFAVDPGPASVPDVVSECWGTERLDDLCAVSDWLVICAPIIDETRHSIDSRRMELMPKGSHIVVISRGGIVDENAMASAIKSGHLAGAGIDATEVEPLPQDSPLWDLDEVFISPHASALTPELYEGRREAFRSNLRRFLAGEALEGLCDQTLGY